jgi:vacuolar-type H+-ATPase subunit H
MLATSQVQAGQVQDARMILEAAVHALEQYAQRTDQERALQAQSLRKEIQDYAQQLPQQAQKSQQRQQKHQQAVEQINVWDRIVQLSDEA